MPRETMPTTQSHSSATLAELDLGEDVRILVLAPHPDDESLACGGLIQRAVSRGLPVHIAFFTMGDNNEWSFMVYRKRPELLPWQTRQMGEVRHDEAMAAARTLGLTPDALTFLGYPDFGTLHIWSSHWGDAPPFRSMLTRATSVPYANAFRPGAAYKGEEIVRDLTALFRATRPTRIFVSHPADHNPDHAALYLFSRVALWDLREELGSHLHPFLVHYPHWPQPRGLAPADAIAPPEHLAAHYTWRDLALTGVEVERKEAAVRAHRTQYGYSRTYLESFVRVNELYADLADVRLSVSSEAGFSARSAATAPGTEPAEQLEEEERVRFVGVESRAVRVVGGDLELSTLLSRPLGAGVTASFYCFGYRAGRPFSEMPKLHIEVGKVRHRVMDGLRALPGNAVEVRRTARSILVRLPLAQLGRPERAFVGGVTRLGDIPLSAQPWYILELPTASPT